MIDQFAGPHEFLSNFYPSPVRIRVLPDAVVVCPTVEHAFQACKTQAVDERRAIAAAPTPAAAKRMGRAVVLRPDWEQVKVGVMRVLLAQKFVFGGELAGRLLATGDEELVEGNTWGDRYWGAVAGDGQNVLGRLLMERRALLRAMS